MDPRALPEPSEVTANSEECREATLGEVPLLPPSSENPVLPNLPQSLQSPHTDTTYSRHKWPEGTKAMGTGGHSVLQQVPKVICLKEVCDTLTLKPPEIVILFQGG